MTTPTQAADEYVATTELIAAAAAEIARLRAANAALTEALKGLTAVIEAAGLRNLTRGVQLGSTAWYVKASDAMEAARAALASVEVQ